MEAAATTWLNAADVPVRRAASAKKLFAAAATEKIVRDRPLHSLSPYERQRLAEALDAEEAALAAPPQRSTTTISSSPPGLRRAASSSEGLLPPNSPPLDELLRLPARVAGGFCGSREELLGYAAAAMLRLRTEVATAKEAPRSPASRSQWALWAIARVLAQYAPTQRRRRRRRKTSRRATIWPRAGARGARDAAAGAASSRRFCWRAGIWSCSTAALTLSHSLLKSREATTLSPRACTRRSAPASSIEVCDLRLARLQPSRPDALTATEQAAAACSCKSGSCPRRADNCGDCAQIDPDYPGQRSPLEYCERVQVIRRLHRANRRDERRSDHGAADCADLAAHSQTGGDHAERALRVSRPQKPRTNDASAPTSDSRCVRLADTHRRR